MISPLVASFACLLICCLAIAVFPLGSHRAARDACTTPSPALGARRDGDPGEPSTGTAMLRLPGKSSAICTDATIFLCLERVLKKARRRTVCPGPRCPEIRVGAGVGDTHRAIGSDDFGLQQARSDSAVFPRE